MPTDVLKAVVALLPTVTIVVPIYSIYLGALIAFRVLGLKRWELFMFVALQTDFLNLGDFYSGVLALLFLTDLKGDLTPAWLSKLISKSY